MTVEQQNQYLHRAVEVFMHVGLVVLLVVACFVILRPFLLAITWGIIVAVALYPAYRKLERLLGGRGNLAATLSTLLLLAILLLPVTLGAGTLVKGTQSLAARVNQGTLAVPPPPPTVATWPIIGTPLNRIWSLASTDLTSALNSLAPQIQAVMPKVLSASAGLALTVVQFVFSILIAGFLLAKAGLGTQVTRSLANRLFSDRGPEFHKLITSTIRRVTVGILGVAFIQAVFAGLGFLVGGLPGAAVWITTTTKAVIFVIWCVVVGLMDNVLKPLLLGRGLGVPIAVVFLGAIGGFIAMGIIGLFVGAVVMSVGYELALTWMNEEAA